MLVSVDVRKVTALVCLAALLLALSAMSSGLPPAVLCPFWVFLAIVVLARFERAPGEPERYSFLFVRSGGSRAPPPRIELPHPLIPQKPKSPPR